MSIRVRKILYEIHYDHIDADGNLVGEPVVQATPGPNGPERLALYPHQFSTALTARAAEIADLVQAQLAPPPAPATNGNRAQRRAQAKAS